MYTHIHAYDNKKTTQMSDAFSSQSIWLEVMGYNAPLHNYACILQINPNISSSYISCSTALITLSLAQDKELHVFS